MIVYVSQLGSAVGVSPLTLTLAPDGKSMTGTISLASGSTNGYLSSGDWSAFNSKLGSGVTSLVGVSPVSVSQTGNSGTITLSLAGATQNGYLSSTDWSTFNNKLGNSTNTISLLGGLSVAANLTANNYSGTHSGTSSGTNTGDQTLRPTGGPSGTSNYFAGGLNLASGGVASATTFATGTIYACRFIRDASTPLNAIYLRTSSSGAATATAYLYANSGNVPAGILQTLGTLSVGANAHNRWAVTDPGVGDYWFAVEFSANASIVPQANASQLHGIIDPTSSSSRVSVSHTFGDPPPNPFGTPTFSANATPFFYGRTS